MAEKCFCHVEIVDKDGNIIKLAVKDSVARATLATIVDEITATRASATEAVGKVNEYKGKVESVDFDLKQHMITAGNTKITADNALNIANAATITANAAAPKNYVDGLIQGINQRLLALENYTEDGGAHTIYIAESIYMYLEEDMILSVNGTTYRQSHFDYIDDGGESGTAYKADVGTGSYSVQLTNPNQYFNANVFDKNGTLLEEGFEFDRTFNCDIYIVEGILPDA